MTGLGAAVSDVTPPGGEISSLHVAMRLAAELEILQATVQRLETAVSRAVGPGRWPQVGADDLEQLQALDLLQQSLADLKRVATALAASPDGRGVEREAMVEACFLSDIRKRLLAEADQGDAGARASGDLDLF